MDQPICLEFWLQEIGRTVTHDLSLDRAGFLNFFLDSTLFCTFYTCHNFQHFPHSPLCFILSLSSQPFPGIPYFSLFYFPCSLILLPFPFPPFPSSSSVFHFFPFPEDRIAPHPLLPPPLVAYTFIIYCM